MRFCVVLWLVLVSPSFIYATYPEGIETRFKNKPLTIEERNNLHSLIDNLEHKQFSIRDKAEKQLRQLGMKNGFVDDVIKDVLDHSPPENAKHRLKSIHKYLNSEIILSWDETKKMLLKEIRKNPEVKKINDEISSILSMLTPNEASALVFAEGRMSEINDLIKKLPWPNQEDATFVQVRAKLDLLLQEREWLLTKAVEWVRIAGERFGLNFGPTTWRTERSPFLGGQLAQIAYRGKAHFNAKEGLWLTVSGMNFPADRQGIFWGNNKEFTIQPKEIFHPRALLPNGKRAVEIPDLTVMPRLHVRYGVPTRHLSLSLVGYGAYSENLIELLGWYLKEALHSPEPLTTYLSIEEQAIESEIPSCSTWASSDSHSSALNTIDFCEFPLEFK